MYDRLPLKGTEKRTKFNCFELLWKKYPDVSRVSRAIQRNVPSEQNTPDS